MAKVKPKTKVERKRAARATAREVPPFPKISTAWRAKRKACADSLLEFCRTFLKPKFFLAFSPDHFRVIAKLERIVRGGGLVSVAMPRGSGKSELAKAAALWAILYGYRKFVVIVGATTSDAVRVAEDLKATLAHSDDLYAAFPEAAHCVRELKGISTKARFQTINGKPSGLEWKREGFRLAFVPKAACSGAVLRTAGLTGAIRGMTATGPNGETIRPDLALLDDPQDRESATSPAQTDDRERIVRGDVLGLAGPTTTIAAVMCCTVITENDLADRFLNRELNPQWNGERTKLVTSFPTDEVLWEQYFALRDDDMRAGGDGRVATEFYRARRTEMDAGGAVSWPERFDAERYASALEEAMVKKHDDPEAFAAEMQNDPLRASSTRGEERQLHAAELVTRLNRLPCGTVPREATRLTAMIDVGGRVMWWGVVAWSERFDGAVVDYGAWPQQSRGYFTSTDARPSLIDLYPGRTEGQLVYAGLRDLSRHIFGRDYPRDGGPAMAVERGLVDAGWLPDTVHQFVRESEFRHLLIPSKGYATSSSAKAMDDWPAREGERSGPSWRLGVPPSGRGRQLLFDPDYWKSFLADRLTTEPGSGGSLRFFGASPSEHRMLCDHLTSEYATRTTIRNRTFDSWEKKPGGAENHLLDVLTGCAVAASVGGLVWSASGEPVARPTGAPRQRLSLAKRIELKRKAKENGLEALQRHMMGDD